MLCFKYQAQPWDAAHIAYHRTPTSYLSFVHFFLNPTLHIRCFIVCNHQTIDFLLVADDLRTR
jgi:hypothetical protein